MEERFAAGKGDCPGAAGFLSCLQMSLPAGRPGFVLLPLLLALAAGVAGAHDSLYLYAEVRLPDRGEGGGGELVFSVHAAELPSAAALGADPLGTSLDWFERADGPARGLLLGEAADYVARTFEVSLDGTNPRPAGAERGFDLVWPSFPAEESEAATAARPGFLAASASLPPGSRRVIVRLSPLAEKRLLVVINRPGAFPKVHDLAPGESLDLPLALSTE